MGKKNKSERITKLHTSLARVAAITAPKAPATMTTGPMAKFHLAEIILILKWNTYSARSSKASESVMCNYAARRKIEVSISIMNMQTKNPNSHMTYQKNSKLSSGANCALDDLNKNLEIHNTKEDERNSTVEKSTNRHRHFRSK